MKETSVINAAQVSPSVSILISSEKTYPQYKTNEKKLQYLLEGVKEELSAEFPQKKVEIITKKLEGLIASIKHQDLSKSIVLYASPEKEKLFYLPFPVKERVIIDSSFEIRDLIYAVKNSIEYWILLINGKLPKLYFGHNSLLTRTETESFPPDIENKKRDYPSKVANFSDDSAIKEIILDNYLKEVDRALTVELAKTKAPVFICGAPKLIGHFKALTKNASYIKNYIEGNYEHFSKEEIYKLVEPSIEGERKAEQRKALEILETATDKKEFTAGIGNVWRAAKERKGRLLLVEKDYTCAAKIGKDEYTLVSENFDTNDPGILKDAVDDIIELVLKSDGDIAFVDNGKLKDYNKIALVTYY